MTTSIAAIFENGAFRPTTPLTLAEGTRVELIFVTEKKDKPNGNAAAAILASIAALPTAGGDPMTSKNHDQVLYGKEGAR
jgi:predicted DNA-binding antitoxin AbrB/MazE fold protein